jgi:hypothetical protein
VRYLVFVDKFFENMPVCFDVNYIKRRELPFYRSIWRKIEVSFVRKGVERNL